MSQLFDWSAHCTSCGHKFTVRERALGERQQDEGVTSRAVHNYPCPECHRPSATFVVTSK